MIQLGQQKQKEGVTLSYPVLHTVQPSVLNENFQLDGFGMLETTS